MKGIYGIFKAKVFAALDCGQDNYHLLKDMTPYDIACDLVEFDSDFEGQEPNQLVELCTEWKKGFDKKI